MTRPDSPCIAICSTSQGDDVCKGCGRTFEEVTNWVVMSEAQKDAVWQRIEQEGTSLRYTTYRERALEAGVGKAAPASVTKDAAGQ